MKQGIYIGRAVLRIRTTLSKLEEVYKQRFTPEDAQSRMFRDVLTAVAIWDQTDNKRESFDEKAMLLTIARLMYLEKS